MTNNNSVVFKADKNGIIIILDKNIKFEDIKNTLKLKISDAKKFFDNSKTSIRFKGRKLKEYEKYELLNIISNTTNMNISFLDMDKNNNKNLYTNIENKITKTNNTNFNKDTLFHKGSLRSGQIIQHKGNVVIIGSINPGAKVVASGHIIILGSLKGLVHAGCDGNDNSFVASLQLMSAQLRISKFITYIPKDNSQLNPSLSYINEGKIYIQELV